MIPPDPIPRQDKPPGAPRQQYLDPEDSPHFPTCGTPRLPCDLRLSRLLDLALLTSEAASTLLAALEAEALP
jgi:hypothetical protein